MRYEIPLLLSYLFTLTVIVFHTNWLNTLEVIFYYILPFIIITFVVSLEALIKMKRNELSKNKRNLPNS